MGHERDQYVKFRFPGQREGETIRLLIRKHWIADLKIAVIFFVIGSLPLIIGIAGGILTWDGHFNDRFVSTLIILFLYFLVVVEMIYIKWLNEELDIIIATDERIVSHEQIDLFHRQISEANLTQIQDVTGIENGFLQSVLHYGTVEIQTSSSDVFFVMNHVSNPYENARILLDLRDKAANRHRT